VRAAFVMAPAPVQALDPDSLARMRLPVHIVLGDADTVAPPATNGLVAAQTIPNAELERLPGVGHYDFLSSCTDAGKMTVRQCKIDAPQAETHRRAGGRGVLRSEPGGRSVKRAESAAHFRV
jgi:predicted dienelactone hydrolase